MHLGRARLNDQVPVGLRYFELGRMTRCRCVLGDEKVLRYEEVEGPAGEKGDEGQQQAPSGLVQWALARSLRRLPGLPEAARTHLTAPKPPTKPIGACAGLEFYGSSWWVMLTNPADLDRAFGAEAFSDDIESVLPIALRCSPDAVAWL